MVGQRETEGEVRWCGVDERRSEVYVVCRRRVRWWGQQKTRGGVRCHGWDER